MSQRIRNQSIEFSAFFPAVPDWSWHCTSWGLKAVDFQTSFTKLLILKVGIVLVDGACFYFRGCLQTFNF